MERKSTQPRDTYGSASRRLLLCFLVFGCGRWRCSDRVALVTQSAYFLNKDPTCHDVVQRFLQLSAEGGVGVRTDRIGDEREVGEPPVAFDETRAGGR